MPLISMAQRNWQVIHKQVITDNINICNYIVTVIVTVLIKYYINKIPCTYFIGGRR